MMTETLYFTDERSDKVYTATITKENAVQFAWGRRGGTMQTKTVGPFSPSEAAELYEQKLGEKRAKGYVSGDPATPLETYGTPSDPVMSDGLRWSVPRPRPMLLNEISAAELLELAPDPDIYFQEKHDGDRIILVKRDGRLTSYSRSGRETSALPRPIVQAAMESPWQDFTIDGEIVGDTIWAFDVLRVTADMTACPYAGRLELLHKIFGESSSGIRVVETAMTPDAKLFMFACVREAGGEGVVLKRASAPYTPGRPNSGGPALKYKFVATATVIVASHNPQRSVNMKLADGTELGSVTIPPNKEVPPLGAIIEVRYLYAHRGGSLSQPVFLSLRKDIEPAECTINQLRFKGEQPNA